MAQEIRPQYYRDYLQLDKILAAQAPASAEYESTAAHDELLFIITHQAYELWFKQILHEVSTVCALFDTKHLPEQHVGKACHYIERVNKILHLLVDQIGIMETMTPLDFCDFRDYLHPASGFQSLQFRMLEAAMGLRKHKRVTYGGQQFHSRLDERDQKDIEELAQKPSLFDLVERWLARMPFAESEDFRFRNEYAAAVHAMLQADRERLHNSGMEQKAIMPQLQQIDANQANFDALFDAERYQELRENDIRRMSLAATRAALFINVYRDEALLQMPYRFLNALVDMDELITLWRYRHALMVSRMIGSKVGTGGSSGHDYLLTTAGKHRVFKDISDMSSFFIPRRNLPELPESIRRKLRFAYENDGDAA